jgi:hypothetical protein
MGIVSTTSSHRWPNGRVPFEIDEVAFPDGSQMRQVILDAIAEWNNGTPLRLVPRDGDASHILFREFYHVEAAQQRRERRRSLTLLVGDQFLIAAADIHLDDLLAALPADLALAARGGR